MRETATAQRNCLPISRALHDRRRVAPYRTSLLSIGGQSNARPLRTNHPVYIDDATSRLMHLQFVESESTFDYFAASRLFWSSLKTTLWNQKTFLRQSKISNPDLERFLAKRMNATTVELEAGHLSLVSHPKEIADLILAAAGRQK
jgi:hypothetical protein